MPGGREPLPPGRRPVVAHKAVDVVPQRLGLGEVGMPQQVDVEVGHRDRVDAGRHGVGDEVARSWHGVQSFVPLNLAIWLTWHQT